MKKHIIAGTFAEGEYIVGSHSSNEVITYLNLLSEQGKLNFGIGNVINDLAKINVFPSEIGLDLLLLATHVQAADTLISRDTESQDSWTREIKLIIPVVELPKWVAAQDELIRALNFLTGDRWEIEFRQRENTWLETNNDSKNTFSDVSLFSGGLDSLIGAIDLLKANNTPLFISHVSEGAVSEAQQKCFDALKTNFPNQLFERLRAWMNFPGVKINGSRHENTMRGRSFLFIALGVFAGTGLQKPFRLVVPENGFIALNVPLDQLRLGSHSTKTTHPFYLARWSSILAILGIDVKIVNPYWDKTKGEMILNCHDLDILNALVPVSLSCSSPSKARYLGIHNQHCGYCVPCIIRRAAIEKGLGNNSDKTKYTLADLRQRPLNSLRAEGQQIRSFQLSLRRFKRNPNNVKVLIHSAGSLKDVTPENKIILERVYKNGLAEVAAIVENVVTIPLK